jgi:hypothetical protein
MERKSPEEERHEFLNRVKRVAMELQPLFDGTIQMNQVALKNAVTRIDRLQSSKGNHASLIKSSLQSLRDSISAILQFGRADTSLLLTFRESFSRTVEAMMLEEETPMAGML